MRAALRRRPIGLRRWSEEAIAVYGQVADRFGEDPEPALCESAARARLAREELIHALVSRTDSVGTVHHPPQAGGPQPL